MNERSPTEVHNNVGMQDIITMASESANKCLKYNHWHQPHMKNYANIALYDKMMC